MTKINEYLPRHPIGWKYDLPLPTEEPPVSFNPALLPPTPNQINNTYMEVSRATLSTRGLGSIGGIITLLLSLLVNLPFIYDSITNSSDMNIGFILLGYLFIIISCWAIIPYIRIDLELPRDEPIRFNRSRQKVYFYQYRFDRISVFSRKKWGIHPVAYDWKDLTAEVCSVYAPMGNGGVVEKVLFAVRKPGTDEIIDRLFLTHNIEVGTRYWEIIRLFMQQGPDALPTFVRPPRDWDNDFELTPIRRLAPRVQWPEAIDRESRTGPAAGEPT
ncbi:DUF6708 domain-containing protein [Pseudomonas peradeniyensis]|uniref:DUF6708 domain-containing protein n=1 Tax=Pseudomonas peradeniyensis TaxID=2745488 RepID=UPI001CECFA8B|nr:DUF6708 domain-containing protein [Pseudomonas peradeniyensis]